MFRRLLAISFAAQSGVAAVVFTVGFVASMVALLFDELNTGAVCVGFWCLMLAVISGILWASFYFTSRGEGGAHRRNAGHLCTTCGYDLRATPDRCPECGTRAARSPNVGV